MATLQQAATVLVEMPVDDVLRWGWMPSNKMPRRFDLPLRPFFGFIGVAPPLVWGRICSLIPCVRVYAT